jgi:hypothetical protein
MAPTAATGRKLALNPAKTGRTGAWSKRRPWRSAPRLRDDRLVGPPRALTTASARKLPARCGVACWVPESSAVAVAWERTSGCGVPARSRQRGCRPAFGAASPRMVPAWAARVRGIAGSSCKFPWVEAEFACRRGVDRRCTGESCPARQQFLRPDGDIAVPSGVDARWRPDTACAIGKYPASRRTVAVGPGIAGWARAGAGTGGSAVGSPAGISRLR